MGNLPRSLSSRPIPPTGLVPLETSYKGYRFRSRTEARWAVFFDALGIKWGYEVEGYNLGDDVCYLPDFWLSAVSDWPVDDHSLNSCFFEVKGKPPTLEERRKARLLAEQSGYPVIIASGVPGDEQMWFNQNGERDEQCEWTLCKHNCHVGIAYIDDCVLQVGDCDLDFCLAVGSAKDPIRFAREAARSARFST